MDSTQTTVLIIHTVIALAIIGLVLLQRGKGADAGAAFGAGASGTVFGARGSTSFFSRATAILATAFFATSLTLAYMSSQRTTAPDSLIESLPQAEAPANQPETSADELLPELPDLDSATPEAEDAAMPSLDEPPAAEGGSDEPQAE